MKFFIQALFCLLTIRASGIEVSVLTCSPGTELYSAFGHSAIRIKDPSRGHDLVYNYGTFDFATEGFYIKFARGKLDYMLARQPFHSFQFEYLRDNRSIHEQILIADEEQLKRLWALLEENLLPENRFYKYDFFKDNCSTRIWEIINLAFDEQLVGPTSPHKLGTFRQAVELCLKNMSWSKIGISLALGAPYDRKMNPGEERFLPANLMSSMAGARVNGIPLVGPAIEILNKEESESPRSALPQILSALVLIGFLWLKLRKKSNSLLVAGKILSWLTALVGILQLLLWFATDHSATALNPDLLWTFPFIVFLVGAPRYRIWLHRVALICLLLSVVYYVSPIRSSFGVLVFMGCLLISLFIYHREALRQLKLQRLAQPNG